MSQVGVLSKRMDGLIWFFGEEGGFFLFVGVRFLNHNAGWVGSASSRTPRVGSDHIWRVGSSRIERRLTRAWSAVGRLVAYTE